MSVIDNIKYNFKNLSQTQKTIADFIINKPEVACFCSLKEMSEKVNVTEVTILKFAKKLGYASFLELKKELQKYIQNKLSPNERLVVAVKDIKKDVKDNYLEIIDSEIQALVNTTKLLNVNDIDRAVKCIRDAPRIFLVGDMVSKTVVKYLQVRLRSLGINAITYDLSTYTDISHQLLDVNSDDVFILSCFPRYSGRTVRVFNYLRERKVKVIAFTDKLTSPIAENSFVTFRCITDTSVFYNSMNPPIALANILISSLAIVIKDRFENTEKKAQVINSFLHDCY
ncbi:MurR/RpiR family transcriptional regulator [Clostridium sp. 'deep sea']|uniref:MurR/RpiR family transcriptional regulator n=1 Tax=Clostridium sp. 'deep sea' TaxID=2779445 RepID=UPI0018966DE9|nr:MurR/RpiR family transcriptional regulator [Clostridium sp. 'deep sea']QOR34548.1 MurR/RpiR family transcriptional regulator [Clostridium sp. 'deep sea']